MGATEQTYSAACPACGQRARLTVRLVIDAHPSAATDAPAPTTVTFRFRCLRGCEPSPVALRALWTTAMDDGNARHHTA